MGDTYIDAHQVAALTVRVVRLLQHRGRLDSEAPDPLAQDQPLLAGVTDRSTIFLPGLIQAGITPENVRALKGAGLEGLSAIHRPRRKAAAEQPRNPSQR